MVFVSFESKPVLPPTEPGPTATSGLQLQVLPAAGSVSGAIGDVLQGPANVQSAPSNSQVEQPSLGLLDYLQPNSGASDFSGNRSDKVQ